MVDIESLQNLEKLHQLKNEGIISDEEFEKSKERLLFGHKTKTIAASAPVLTPAPDDHIGWMILPLKKYADFTGRSSRKEYWMFKLLFVALFLVSAVLSGSLGAEAAGALFVIGLLGLLVPLVAVQVRRFHDQDKSGWFALINLIPYVGAFVVLAFMLIEGTRGSNRFGADPR